MNSNLDNRESSVNDENLNSDGQTPMSEDKTLVQEALIDEQTPIEESNSETTSSHLDFDIEINGQDEDHSDEKSSDADSNLTVEDIVSELKRLLETEELPRKTIEELKNNFYKIVRAETEALKSAFVNDGGVEEDFTVPINEVYEEGKSLLQKVKEKRAQLIAEEDALREKNATIKEEIINKITELADSQEDFGKIYQEFKQLQQEWKDIKQVPQAKVNDLWKMHQHAVEKFYDLMRINNEFRDYDFKKNYEAKLALCETSEKLIEESDVVSSFHQLQKLHQDWREIGPVSRAEREPLWLRFKEASANINKRYQEHYENIKKSETDNLEKKTSLCEQLEAIDYSQLSSFKTWDTKMNEILDIQTQWKQIGFVPKKVNTSIFERYRAACDLFFKNKNDFYKKMREDMDSNYHKKLALCEKAEELKDSQDWRKTSNELIALQKEWKQIGVVPRKYVDSIWKRFVTACDYFFEQKKIHTSSQQNEEVANLENKKELTEKIKNIDPTMPIEEAIELLRSLVDEWYKVGFVPFKQKDKIYKEFHDAADAQFERLKVSRSEQKLDNFKSNISELSKNEGSKRQLLSEREKLMRRYERMKIELKTYENNIGFLSISSKKGSSLIDDMSHKMKGIEEELALLVKKIEAIDENL